MIIKDAHKNIITKDINFFIMYFGRVLRRSPYNQLKCIMEDIELCIDNNNANAIFYELPDYLTLAKVEIRDMTNPNNKIVIAAINIINTIERLTPLVNDSYPLRRNSSLLYSFNKIQQANDKDKGSITTINRASRASCTIS